MSVHNSNEFSSESEEEEREKASSFSRRGSVVGSTYDPETDEDESPLEKYPKPAEEMERIKNEIRGQFLFKVLDEAVLGEVVEAMAPRDIEKDQIITREGEGCDFFYVVDRGRFVATIKGKQVNVYEDSGSFGELALLHDQPRAATITAATEGRLFIVSRDTFTRLVRKRAHEKRRSYMQLMDKLPELKPLSEYDRMQVSDTLTHRGVMKGQEVFKQGSEADGMYFVVKGEVSVQIDGVEKKILKQGDFFGELELVKNQPRAATVVAKRDTKLAFLDVEDFELLLGPCKNLLDQRAKTYKR